MATQLTLGDIWQVKIASVVTGQVGLNVTQWQVANVGGTGATDLQMAGVFDNLFAPVYKAILSVSAEYYGVQVQRIKPLPLTLAVTSAIATAPGQILGAPLPYQVSGVITMTTQQAGRAYRGRRYIPFPGAASNDLNNVNPNNAYVNLLQAIGNVMSIPVPVGANPNNATLVPVIFHRKTGLTTPIVGFRANQKWGTQRRRGNYGRQNQFPPF